jgi:hypothetical protein
MIELIRFGLFKDRTIGRLIYEGDVFYTVERPWLDNQQNISCIPTGTYQLGRVNSPKFGPGTWEIQDVPNRSNILLHAGNTQNDVSGCLAVGLGVFGQLQGVSTSRQAIENLYLTLASKITEEITIRDGTLS